jgi:hypothetical protein
VEALERAARQALNPRGTTTVSNPREASWSAVALDRFSLQQGNDLRNAGQSRFGYLDARGLDSGTKGF